jgi:hypothetical protein
MLSDEERSRIDAKIKRDDLLTNGIEDLWITVWEAIQGTCNKVDGHWKTGLSYKLNDGNSVIRVNAPTEQALVKQSERQLEIRFDRAERKIVVRIPHLDINGSHPIKPDHEAEHLKIDGKTPLAFAEWLIAERFLKLDLT